MTITDDRVITEGGHFYTLNETQRTTGPTYWSHSAAEKAGARSACPLEWAYRHGPLRDEAPPEGVPHPARLRGNVVHDAFAAAYRHAMRDAEQAGKCSTLIGSNLERYWTTCRVEFGKAWERYAMPSDRGEAVLCEDILRYMLRVASVPAPGTVWALEDKRTSYTPMGREFRYTIDLARWVHGGARLRITDWKSGNDDVAEVETNKQLNRYAWCAARELRIELDRVEIELHNVRTRESACVRVDPMRAQRMIERVDEIAEEMERTVRAGRIPARPGGRCSSCALCEGCPVRKAYRAPRPDRYAGEEAP